MNMFLTPTDPGELPFAALVTGASNVPENLSEVDEVPGESGLIGDYRVLDVLGQGGMGTVYRVYDLALKRQLAVKVMLGRFATDQVTRARFVREAQAQAAVVHDHIVPIYHVGQDRGVPYFAMPVLVGENLATALNREPRQPLAEVFRIGCEVTEGLAMAHSVGLVHRDIKPANVWLEAPTGRVKLVDFGIARRISGAEGTDMLTAVGAIVGTPAYMSPEQARGLSVDCRSDLFSVGAVLYQMTTGKKPFQGSDVVSALFALAWGPSPLPPVAVNPAVPPALSDLIMQLLEKQPDDRPPSARHVADELRRIAARCRA